MTDPAGGFILWIELPGGLDSTALFEACLTERICIAPGTMFSATGRYRHCIRLGVGGRWDRGPPRRAAPHRRDRPGDGRAQRRMNVAVRTLCAFTAKTGDLDVRFTPAPTALEGQEGHAAVAARRGAGYQREISLSGQHGELRVRSRADGFDPDRGRLEIKTHRGAGALVIQPANHRALHWAQAMIYGWLLCERDGLAQIELALVCFDIGCRRGRCSPTLDAETLRF